MSGISFQTTRMPLRATSPSSAPGAMTETTRSARAWTCNAGGNSSPVALR